MSPEKVEDAASWSVVDAATHGSSTHPGSAQRALWPLDPLVPSKGDGPVDDDPRLPRRDRS
ncbi:hypothetical protein [Clavibacter nebraskensis]|uniref:hypothetical protein n=1 Tax=Clavibacter nebraskensis TaxID=31963 RepID=UPI003F856D9A